MRRRRHSLAGTSALPTGFTFPAHLLKPQQSQIAQYSDGVSDRIAQLDLHARHLGEGFGIPMTGFVLNPPPHPHSDDRTAVALALLHVLAVREEMVSLERQGGEWGLFFTRGISLLSRERISETVRLRDAPLDVRERFLVRSHEFFEHYLKLCEDRLGKMRIAIGVADQTIAHLSSVELKP